MYNAYPSNEPIYMECVINDMPAPCQRFIQQDNQNKLKGEFIKSVFFAIKKCRMEYFSFAYDFIKDHQYNKSIKIPKELYERYDLEDKEIDLEGVIHLLFIEAVKSRCIKAYRKIVKDVLATFKKLSEFNLKQFYTFIIRDVNDQKVLSRFLDAYPQISHKNRLVPTGDYITFLAYRCRYVMIREYLKRGYSYNYSNGVMSIYEYMKENNCVISLELLLKEAIHKRECIPAVLRDVQNEMYNEQIKHYINEMRRACTKP